MVSALQTALTAHEVYRMTGDAGMIQIADAELGRLAPNVRRERTFQPAPSRIGTLAPRVYSAWRSFTFVDSVVTSSLPLPSPR